MSTIKDLWVLRPGEFEGKVECLMRRHFVIKLEVIILVVTLFGMY